MTSEKDNRDLNVFRRQFLLQILLARIILVEAVCYP
jgi:hypothetical protein